MALYKSTRREFLRSQAIVKKRRKKRMIRVSIRVVLLLLLIYSLSLLSKIDFFQVQNIVISGNIHMQTEEIQEMVHEELKSTYLGLFPRRNVFFYPKQRIIKDILEKYPIVKGVQVYTESFNILNIRIEEREQVAGWCSVIECYKLDSTAFIYAAMSNEEQANTSFITFEGLEDKVGTQPVGVYLLDEHIFEEILNVASQMSTISLPVEKIEFRSKDEVYFWIKGSDASESTQRRRIIFSTEKEYQESFNNLKAALASKVFATSTQFEYIDTRFGNKVFYRLVPSVDKTASTTSKTKRN